MQGLSRKLGESHSLSMPTSHPSRVGIWLRTQLGIFQVGNIPPHFLGCTFDSKHRVLRYATIFAARLVRERVASILIIQQCRGQVVRGIIIVRPLAAQVSQPIEFTHENSVLMQLAMRCCAIELTSMVDARAVIWFFAGVDSCASLMPSIQACE